ncbi:MAG: site-specific integrase [Acidimicrobiales bacterium]
MPEWKLGASRPEQRAPSLEEVRALLSAAEELDLRLATFLRVIAAIGARRSEICALRWSDLNRSAASILLDKATVADGGVGIKGPKTRASIRRVAIDAGTLAALDALEAERKALAEECELELPLDGFVFATDPSGAEPPHPDGM